MLLVGCSSKQEFVCVACDEKPPIPAPGYVVLADGGFNLDGKPWFPMMLNYKAFIEGNRVIPAHWYTGDDMKFFLNGEEKASNTYTLAYGECQNMSFSFTAHEVASDQKAWFEVSYNQQTVKSDEKTFNIVAESDEVNAKTISGIVVYDDDETWTIANVSIVLKAIDKDVIYQTVSDDKGQFSIKIYRSDLQYTLTATKEGLDEYTQPIVYVNDGNEYTIKMTDIQTNIDPQNSARPEDACKARYLKPQIIYDLQGRCVNNKAKGIIIINGKKTNKK